MNKTLVASLLALTSASISCGRAPEAGSSVMSFEGEPAKYVCVQYARNEPTKLLPMNVVLQPAEDFTTENGKYLLEVYEGAKESPVSTIKGVVESEDVMFFFNSTDGKTNLNIYMDELSESSLTLNDSDKGSFICR